MATYEELAQLLIAALTDREKRLEIRREFMRRFNYEPQGDNPEVNELLDLAMSDLADYEPNPEARKGRDYYRDDEQIERIIRKHLKELDRLGVKIPPGPWGAE
jgi:hypothetical protein